MQGRRELTRARNRLSQGYLSRAPSVHTHTPVSEMYGRVFRAMVQKQTRSMRMGWKIPDSKNISFVWPADPPEPLDTMTAPVLGPLSESAFMYSLSTLLVFNCQ